ETIFAANGFEERPPALHPRAAVPGREVDTRFGKRRAAERYLARKKRQDVQAKAYLAGSDQRSALPDTADLHVAELERDQPRLVERYARRTETGLHRLARQSRYRSLRFHLQAIAAEAEAADGECSGNQQQNQAGGPDGNQPDQPADTVQLPQPNVAPFQLARRRVGVQPDDVAAAEAYLLVLQRHLRRTGPVRLVSNVDESRPRIISRAQPSRGSDFGMTELSSGDLAPDFELARDGGGTLRLSALRGQRVVLFFYPKDDTEACTAEAVAFSSLKSQFAQAGATLVGISPDSPKK